MEELTSEVAEPKYSVIKTVSLQGKVVGGKLRNTRTFKHSDGSIGSVANWKLKLEDGTTHDYVAVFDTEADVFKAQILAGEEVAITQKFKQRTTVGADGIETTERMAQPEHSYDAPMGDVASMFS